MKKRIALLSTMILMISFLLQSCGGPIAVTQTVAPASSTDAPVAVVTGEPTAELAALPTDTLEPTPIQHLIQPDNPVYIDTQTMRDCELGFNYVPGQPSKPTTSCDNWEIDFVERPVSGDFMTYSPYLDILEVGFGGNKDWGFGRMVVIDAALPPEHGNLYYMIEIDLDFDNISDILIVAENLRPTDVVWTVNNLRAYRFENGNVVTIFDQGIGDDPDALWVRRSPAALDSTIEFAFKNSFLNGDTSFAWWMWAYEGDSFDPALFIPLDLMPDTYLIDNTCATGFNIRADGMLNACKTYGG